MNISCILINILSTQSLEHKEIQNLTDILLCKLSKKYRLPIYVWHSSGSVYQEKKGITSLNKTQTFAPVDTPKA